MKKMEYILGISNIRRISEQAAEMEATLRLFNILTRAANIFVVLQSDKSILIPLSLKGI